MDNFIFRQATKDEIPRILAMQADVFHGEQGIPADDIDTFLAKKPICWCAESKADGKIYAATAAWQEDNETHWGRFVVFPTARGNISEQSWRKFHLMSCLIWELIKYIWMPVMLP